MPPAKGWEGTDVSGKKAHDKIAALAAASKTGHHSFEDEPVSYLEIHLKPGLYSQSWLKAHGVSLVEITAALAYLKAGNVPVKPQEGPEDKAAYDVLAAINYGNGPAEMKVWLIANLEFWPDAWLVNSGHMLPDEKAEAEAALAYAQSLIDSEAEAALAYGAKKSWPEGKAEYEEYLGKYKTLLVEHPGIAKDAKKQLPLIHGAGAAKNPYPWSIPNVGMAEEALDKAAAYYMEHVHEQPVKVKEKLVNTLKEVKKTKSKTPSVWTVTETDAALGDSGFVLLGPMPKMQPPKPGHKSFNYAKNPWRLAKLDLRQQCADFYLLVAAQFYGMDNGLLAKKVAYLESEFARYSDMAIGGELRHAKKKHLIGVPRPITTALQDGTLPSSRHSAWHGWYFLRQEFGILAIKWAGQTFNLSGWGSGYGGPKWGNIANTLYRYETEMYTPQMFVDTCWSQQHNGGSFFNKTWDTSGLLKLLDAAAGEKPDYPKLAQNASAPIQKRYQEEWYAVFS